MFHASITFESGAREEMIDVTARVEHALAEGNVGDCIVTLFVPHTTAAVTLNENADPSVQSDMLGWLRRLIPTGPHFQHTEDNSDAHLKASLVGPSLQLPFAGGRLRLGTWQAVYFCEFDGPRRRQLELYADAQVTRNSRPLPPLAL